MNDQIKTKKVMCYVQQNGIIRRDDNGYLIGRLTSDFEKEHGFKSLEEDTAPKAFIRMLVKDSEYRESWKANIAMAIYDTEKPKGMTAHEWRNECAENFLKRLTAPAGKESE